MHQIPHASSRKDRHVESYYPCPTIDTSVHIKDGSTTSARNIWIRRHTSFLMINTSTRSALKRTNGDRDKIIPRLHGEWTERLKKNEELLHLLTFWRGIEDWYVNCPQFICFMVEKFQATSTETIPVILGPAVHSTQSQDTVSRTQHASYMWWCADKVPMPTIGLWWHQILPFKIDVSVSLNLHILSV